MALGDLSPDQARYVDFVARATGLNRSVVVAWVGTESGWGITKGGHNYLNVGPGQTFASVDQAAARAAALVNASGYYTGIRAAIPAGPAAQVDAIGASPWGTIASDLKDVYRDLARPAAAAPADPPAAGQPELAVETIGVSPRDALDALSDIIRGLWVPGQVPLPDALKDPLGSAGSAVAGALGLDVDSLLGQLYGLGLGLVFTVAALGLIALGLNRLTGASPRDRFQQMSGALGVAGTAGKVLSAVA